VLHTPKMNMNEPSRVTRVPLSNGQDVCHRHHVVVVLAAVDTADCPNSPTQSRPRRASASDQVTEVVDDADCAKYPASAPKSVSE
jgi:hypothetical protein